MNEPALTSSGNGARASLGGLAQRLVQDGVMNESAMQDAVAKSQEKRVSLAVTAPDQGEIEYRCVCDKFLLIVTRYQTKSKERLILAIRVQPCKDE